MPVHATEDQITALVTLIGDKAAAVHDHDDRYYTTGEIDSLLELHALENHTHLWADITDRPTIPTATSQLTNDSGFLTALPAHNHDALYAPITHSHAYSDLSGLPDLPTHTSDLINDSGYLSALPAHDHDDRYLTEAELSSLLELYALENHTHAYSELTGVPATFAPAAHTHLWADITDKPTTFAPSAHTHAYGDLTGIPSSFTPAAHTHTKSQITDFAHTHLWADITDKPTTFAPSTHTHAYGDLTGIPSTFAPSAHTHTKSQITDFAHTHLWADITDKPTTFTPASHTHTKSQITDFAHTHVKADIADFAHTHLWADITDKPTTFAPSAHTHPATEVTGLAAVATTGSYNDLTNKPAAGAANVEVRKNAISIGTRPAINFTQSGNATVTVSDDPVSGAVNVGIGATSGGFGMVYKFADTSRANTATLADDPDLFISLAANTKYVGRMVIFFDTGATPDFQFSFGGPAGASVIRLARSTQAAGATALGTIATDTAYAVAVPVAGTGTNGGIVWVDFIIHNGATAGNFVFRWAQSAANATATIVRGGSYIEYRTVVPIIP